MNPDKLKDALFKLFMDQVKCGTSWGNVENLRYTLEQTGFTGMFTGLDEFFTMPELKETLEEFWDYHS